MASLLESAVLIFKVSIDNSIDMELFVEREVKTGLRHKGQIQTSGFSTFTFSQRF